MSRYPEWAEVSTTGDLLLRARHLHPERAALVLPDERYTYAQVHDRAVQVARGLKALGVRPGDHVGLLASNGIEYVEGFFGITLLGAVVVPLNARHKATELGYIAANADLVAILTTAHPDQYTDFASVLRQGLPSLPAATDPARLALPETPCLRVTVLLAGSAPGFLSRDRFDELASSVDAAEVAGLARQVRVRDIAAILYTSGTTADPKGCMLSHEALSRGPVERARYRLGRGDRDVTWAAGPLFHIANLAPFIGSVGACGTFVSDLYYDPGRALDLLMREDVTVAFPWFPALVQPLLDHPAFAPERLRSLRTMFLIGPSVLLERVQAALPDCELVAACGMTETAGIYAISDPHDSVHLRATSQGKPYPGADVRIVDLETGADAATGVIGEILVRGFCVMDGYYRAPEKTAQSLDADGWLHTGDLYSWTPEGHLVFHGRLKDMLKVGGENVAAIEIESFLARHPAVEWAEVVGAPDPRLDEVPIAFIEVKDGHTVTADELIEFCRGKIARYKIPRGIRFISPGGWPMSATKINKRALRALLTEASGERMIR